MAAVETPTMPRPARRTGDVTVKIAGSIQRKAKMVASFRDIGLSEYLSSLLEKLVDRDYQQMRKTMDKEEAASDDDA